ncbi:MAG: histidine phosphatase family protein [Thermosulfidibacteraceae bacterium]
MRTVVLFRHGEVVGESRAYFYGHMDVDLSEKGKKDSIEVVEYLMNLEINAVYSSPLKRALFPAKILADRKGIPLFIRDDLREADYGLWTGKLRKEVYRDPLFWERLKDDRISPPKGESIRNLRDRAKRFLDYVKRKDFTLNVVFTHGGFLRALISEILSIESRFFYAFEIYYLRAVIVSFRGDNSIIRGINVSARDIGTILVSSYW